MTQPLHQDSDQPPIGRWTVPGSDAVFTMDPALIQKLRAYVLEGFNILPRRGAEMGGVLLGRILSDEPLQIEITGFEPVTCEYRYGPSYILSDADRSRLTLALSHFNAPGQGRSSATVVVGCFRSCTGRELALDAADQQMMRNYFQDPRQILLSIHPLSIFECEAWFFHRQDGVLPRLPSHPPEPFGRYEPPAMPPPKPPPPPPAPAEAPAESLASLHQAVAAKPAQQTPPPAETPAEQPEAWRMVERRRRARGRRIDDVPAEEYEPEEEAPPPVAEQPPWTLHEEPPKGGRHYPLWQLMLVLVVLLGVAGFGYQWWDAQQRDRWAHLGLDAQPGPAGMEVRWDGTSPALSEASRAVLEIEEAAPAVEGAGAPPVATRRIELDARALSKGRLYYPTGSGDVLFRLKLYSSGLAGATESIRVVARSRGRGTLPAALTAAAPPAPPQTQPQPAPAPEPVKAPAPPAEEPEPPVERAGATPAEAIHEEQPDVGEGVRARIQQPITIAVQVDIDERGHVTRAAAQGDGDGVFRYLAAKAALAAQSWVFKPARGADGAAKATRQTIHFTFHS